MKLNWAVMEFYFIFCIVTRSVLTIQFQFICACEDHCLCADACDFFFFLMLQGYTESVHIRASSGLRSKMKTHQVSGKPQSDVRRQIKQPQEKRDFKIRMVKKIWCMDGRCTCQSEEQTLMSANWSLNKGPDQVWKTTTLHQSVHILLAIKKKKTGTWTFGKLMIIYK